VFARRLRRAGTTELEDKHISRHDGIEWSFEDKDSVLSVPLAALDGLHEAFFHSVAFGEVFYIYSGRVST
jgi:hypothetical protein